MLNIHYKLTSTYILVASILLMTGAQAQQLLIPVPLAPPRSAESVPGTGVTSPSLQMIEPERWTKEDLTHEEQYSTATKETLAAFHQAKLECQQLSPLDQTICLMQAKSIMDQEMAAINLRFGLPNR